MAGSTIRRVVLTVAILTVAAFAAGVGWVTTASSAAPADDGRAFTTCMRAQGLPGFPEVALSSDGLINFDIRGERVDVLSEKYGAAVRACGSLLPTGSRLPGAPAAPSAPSPPS
ncbi:hypothetical protein [Nonomuraea sp. NPDC003804]|uniref:hypothetical protein n=1 Tax=Nonomuraea sp. NPDC003804 TaxID=3154547 RepID=UPI0033A6985C